MKSYSVVEVAKRLRLSRRAVQKHIEAGNIRATRVGSYWTITESAVTSFESRRRKPGRPKQSQSSKS